MIKGYVFNQCWVSIFQSLSLVQAGVDLCPAGRLGNTSDGTDACQCGDSSQMLQDELLHVGVPERGRS